MKSAVPGVAVVNVHSRELHEKKGDEEQVEGNLKDFQHVNGQDGRHDVLLTSIATIVDSSKDTEKY